MKVRLLDCDRATTAAVRKVAARRGLAVFTRDDAAGVVGEAPAIVVVDHRRLARTSDRGALAAAADYLIAAVTDEQLAAVGGWLASGLVDDVLVLPAGEGALAARLAVAERAVAAGSAPHQLATLRTVRAVERVMAEARSPAEVARAALELLRSSIGFDYGSIQLLDFEADQATVLATANADGQAYGGGTIDLTTFGIGFELLQGQPVVVPALEERGEDDVIAAKLAAEGHRAYVHLPLVGRDTLVGSLLLATRRPGGLEPAHLGLAQEVSRALAISLHDSNLLTTVERMAIIDALTGSLTRRHLFELGGYEVQRARRYERPLAAAMIDIDHFKAVNDRWGHGTGDAILGEVAARCRATLRDVDLVGRYGGEEFAVLLPETDLAGGILAAERVRLAIAGSPLDGRGHRVEITVSIGVTALAPADGDLEALLARADAALYEAKDGGRNRTVARARG